MKANTPSDLVSSEQLGEQKHQARAQRRYVKLTMDGTSCVVEPHEAKDMMKDDPILVASDVWMTVSQFEALPDFQGY